MKSENLLSRSNKMLRFAAEFTGGRLLPALHWQDMFAALRYRNYRLWFIGQLVSLIGTWMQTAAQGYLIFQLTQSPAFLGYVGFAAGAPSFVLMLFGGVFADRMPRRNLIIFTQMTMMVLAFTLAALTFYQIVLPWHIVILALCLGVATAFDAPARQSFILEMVNREDLSNAIALNSTMFNLGTLIGPAVAGLIYVSFGPGWCFTINGLSFIAVIASLAKMRLNPINSKVVSSAPFDDFKKGLKYASTHEIIRTLLIVATVMSLFGTIYMTLIPAWAVKVLGGGATTNGWLLSARGLGALGGAMMIAALGRFNHKGRLLSVGMLIFPIMLLVFAMVRRPPLSFLAIMGVGWGFMITFNMLNTLIQSLVADEFRGRVVSLYTLCIFGLMPLGALMAGWEAEIIGAPMTVIVSAIITLGYSIWVFCKVPSLRRQTI